MGGYLRSRSARRPEDMDVPPEWADEALADPDRLVFDPDFASRSGRSVRTIGYSPSADRVLVVITVTEDSRVWGVNAWAANDRDVRAYRQ